MTATMTATRAVGEHLREWRRRRGLSQLELAVEAEVSSRHLSYVETGKANASREMLLRLSETLEIPLRARNALLLSGGFAPAYGERPADDPEMAVVREVLAAHGPYPALAVDRHWNLLAANDAVAGLLVGASPALLAAPTNVLRLSLHPEGLAPRIENLSEWRRHLLTRLRAQAHTTGDPVLHDLLRELAALPAPRETAPPVAATTRIAVPLRLRTERGTLALLSTTTVFGTPLDVALSEIAIETFLPADAATRERLNAL